MFGFILSARYVDAKQYHLNSFSTRNSTLNTSLRKTIRMQDFIQLCDSSKKLCTIIDAVIIAELRRRHAEPQTHRGRKRKPMSLFSHGYHG